MVENSSYVGRLSYKGFSPDTQERKRKKEKRFGAKCAGIDIMAFWE
jgi:hypothetical protein